MSKNMKIISVRRDLGNTMESVDLLISYDTPIAAKVNGEYFATEENFSTTTTKHLKKFLAGRGAHPKSQRYFDDLKTVLENW